jgi:hypothetical protein
MDAHTSPLEGIPGLHNRAMPQVVPLATIEPSLAETTAISGSGDGGTAPAGGPSPLTSGTWSVTRPAQQTIPEVKDHGETSPSAPRVLLAGTDTLDVGLYVEFDRTWPKLVARLAQFKRQARQTGGVLLGDARCLMLAGGKPNYPFLLHYPGFQLYLSRKDRPDGQTPNVYVSINAATLWHGGERDALALVQRELQDVALGTIHEVRISRADLSVDMLIPGGLDEAVIRRHGVGCPQAFRIIGSQDRLETYYRGSPDSPIQMRLYDKSLEIALHDKMWFLPLWGLTTNQDVWRVEFQLRRPCLHDLKINSADDWLAKRSTLWHYLTSSWFRLVLDDDAHVSRRTVHPLWRLVNDAASLFGDAATSCTRRQRRPSGDTSRLMKQFASLVVGYGARRRLGEMDEVLSLLQQELRECLDPATYRASYHRKSIMLGLDETRRAA